ncbi:MAG: Cys-Gln thioester bond-forming surface protein [Anaerolineales bacterium]|nr:Cys-Gln thioester bond-forming surface protein [Anaerolineales bacterium]
MINKKFIALLVAILFSLVVPATWVWAEPPPPSGTPVPQRKPSAPTAGNCITGTGRGATITGTVGSMTGAHWAGVIVVTMADATTVNAFCIDLLHPTYIGDCYTPGGAAEPHVNWLMQNYPPDNSQSNNENAARQAAVWYFSDGFVITSPSTIVTRANQIVAAVPANPSPNTDVPQLTITPGAVILGNGKPYTFTVTATRGGNPMVAQVVNLTTDFGTLGANQVTTGVDGTATFTISNAPDHPGTAHITATFTSAIPVGTVLNDTIPDHQRIMPARSVNAAIIANAMASWANTPTAVTLSSFDARVDTASEPWLVIPLFALASIGALTIFARKRGSR